MSHRWDFSQCFTLWQGNALFPLTSYEDDIHFFSMGIFPRLGLHEKIHTQINARVWTELFSVLDQPSPNSSKLSTYSTLNRKWKTYFGVCYPESKNLWRKSKEKYPTFQSFPHSPSSSPLGWAVPHTLVQIYASQRNMGLQQTTCSRSSSTTPSNSVLLIFTIPD